MKHSGYTSQSLHRRLTYPQAWTPPGTLRSVNRIIAFSSPKTL